jgi:hypothetical protein
MAQNKLPIAASLCAHKHFEATLTWHFIISRNFANIEKAPPQQREYGRSHGPCQQLLRRQ